MTLFQLLNKHGIDRLVGDSKSEAYKGKNINIPLLNDMYIIFFFKIEFRKTVVSSVLATDMSLHSEYVLKIKQQSTRFSTNTLLTDEEERNLLCSALIKCADISNVARPFHWGTKWAELLVQEFVCQGDLEKQLGLPVLPMNDRSKVVLEDSQIGFIKFVALDLFQTVSHVLNEISFAVEQMQKNLKRWESRKEKIEFEEEEFDIVSNSSTTHMIMVETGNRNLFIKILFFAMTEYIYFILLGNKRSSSSLDLHRHNVKKRPSIEKFTANNQDDYNRDPPAYCQCSIQ